MTTTLLCAPEWFEAVTPCVRVFVCVCAVRGPPSLVACPLPVVRVLWCVYLRACGPAVLYDPVWRRRRRDGGMA